MFGPREVFGPRSYEAARRTRSAKVFGPRRREGGRNHEARRRLDHEGIWTTKLRSGAKNAKREGVWNTKAFGPRSYEAVRRTRSAKAFGPRRRAIGRKRAARKHETRSSLTSSAREHYIAREADRSTKPCCEFRAFALRVFAAFAPSCSKRLRASRSSRRFVTSWSKRLRAFVFQTLSGQTLSRGPNAFRANSPSVGWARRRERGQGARGRAAARRRRPHGRPPASARRAGC